MFTLANTLHNYFTIYRFLCSIFISSAFYPLFCVLPLFRFRYSVSTIPFPVVLFRYFVSPFYPECRWPVHEYKIATSADKAGHCWLDMLRSFDQSFILNLLICFCNSIYLAVKLILNFLHCVCTFYSPLIPIKNIIQQCIDKFIIH